MKAFIPSNFVAGSLMFGTQNPLEAAYHCAAVALDDENIRMIASIDQNRVFFLAARSSDFMNNPDSGTALACALPGTDGHRGDGAYIIPIDQDLFGIVIKTEERLESMLGDEADVYAFAQERGAEVHRLSGKDPAVEWQGFRDLELHRGRLMVRRALHIGVGIISLNVLLYLSAALVAGYQTRASENDRAALKTALTAVADHVQRVSQQPAAFTLAEIEAVSQLAIQGRGKVNLFKLEGGKTQYEIEVPEWTEELQQRARQLKLWPLQVEERAPGQAVIRKESAR